jgi:hypothetical protein
VKITSNSGYPLKLKYGEKSIEATTKSGEVLTFNGDLVRQN